MGLLIFFIVKSKSDIAISIKIVTCFTKNSNHAYIKVVKIIFYYPKRLIDYIIIYSNNRENLFIKNYSDSNWVKDKKS